MPRDWATGNHSVLLGTGQYPKAIPSGHCAKGLFMNYRCGRVAAG